MRCEKCGREFEPEHKNQIDMVFTDPPYGMNLNTDWSGAKGHLKMLTDGGRGNKYEKVIGDDTGFNPSFILNGYDCKEIFLWGADYYKEFIPKTGSWFVWDKRSNDDTDIEKVMQSDKMYGSSFELCWSKKRHKREIARIKWAGIFGTAQEPDKNKSRIHPTQKPVRLAEWFINKFSKRGEVIADIFLGSGSTLIACERTGRTLIGMEISPIYIDVIIQRWEEYSGQKAKLIRRDDT